ncbi:hypothetical protein HDV06_003844 [Boothiomyces sp. JEL0866]|nr:hypothetical protein HDV06_003844 [Boothiomyces sp. JEL0866]
MEFDLEAIEIQDPELAAWLPLATHGLIKVTDQEVSLVNRIKHDIKGSTDIDNGPNYSPEQSYSKQEITGLEQRLNLLEHQQKTISQKQEERNNFNNEILEFNSDKYIDLEPLLIKINNKVRESKLQFNLENKTIQDQVLLDYIKAKAWNYYFGGSYCEELGYDDQNMTEIETLQLQNEIRGLFNNISTKISNIVDPQTNNKLQKIESQLLTAKAKLTENKRLMSRLEQIKSLIDQKNEYSPDLVKRVKESDIAREVHGKLHDLVVDLEKRLDQYYQFSKTRHFESEPPLVKQTFDEIKEELHQLQKKQKNYADEISYINE